MSISSVSLQKQYEALHNLRTVMHTMKTNQELRGSEALQQRLMTRATKPNKTWRQLHGIQLALHEIRQPGVQPFMIGLGYVSCSLLCCAVLYTMCVFVCVCV
jgi:hypothetical protein